MRPVPADVRRRPGPLLRRHLRRRLRFPLVAALGGFGVVLLLADLVSFSDLAMNKGFGAEVVAWIALLRLGPVLTQVIPFAVMTAVLATLGRMASEHELLAWGACGLSPAGLVRPVLGFLALPTAVVLLVTLDLAPRANQLLNESLVRAARERPGAALESGSIGVFGDWRLQAREVSADGERLRAAVAWRPAEGEMVFAERATLERENGEPARILLEEGVVLIGERAELSQLRFGRMAQDLRGVEPDFEAVEGIEATTAPGLLRQARDPAAPGPQREARAELHRRAALSFATVLLGLLAIPLGLWPRIRSRSAALLAGFATLVFYYALVQLGEGLLRSGRVPVALAVWLPNLLLLGATGLAMFVVQRGGLLPRRRPGRGRGRREEQKRGQEPPAAAPSRFHRWMLDRFVLARFLELLLLSLLGLILAALLVDVLDNFKWFAKYGSTPSEVLSYYAARLPVLASRLLPMALLAASALSMSLLAASGELLAMRACGIAPSRTVAPILVACALVAGFHYPLSAQWVPRASALASQVKQTEIKDRTRVRRSVWHRDADSFFAIERLDPMRGVAEEVTLYALGPTGLPRTRTYSPRARHLGDGIWELSDPVRHEIGAGHVQPMPADHYAELGEDIPSEVDTDDLPLAALRREIREARADGYDPRRYRVDLHLRTAAPLAGLVLPALVLAFAVAGPPFASAGGVLLWAFALALAHGLLAAVGGALGYAGTLPPPVAAWAPSLLVLLLGGWLGGRLRSRVTGRP